MLSQLSLEDMMQESEGAAPGALSDLKFFGKSKSAPRDPMTKVIIDGRALDRNGLELAVDKPRTLLHLASVWSRKLIAHGESSIESLVPPDTFIYPAVMAQMNVSILLESGKGYIHTPNQVATFVQRTESLISPDERKSSQLPVYQGLAVKVIRLPTSAGALELKSFYTEETSKKIASAKPFRITLGADTKGTRFAVPVDRIVALAKTPSPSATAVVLFTKRPLGAGEPFDDYVLFNQGGCVVGIFGKGRLMWLLFVDFDRTAVSAAASVRPTTAALSAVETDSMTVAARASDTTWMQESSVSPSFVADPLPMVTLADDIDSRIAALSLEDAHSFNKLSPLAEKLANPDQIEQDLIAFRSRTVSHLFVADSKHASQVIVSRLIGSHMIKAMEDESNPNLAHTQLMLVNLSRRAVAVIVEMMREGTWGDLPTSSTKMRNYFKNKTTPAALMHASSVLMQTATLLRWSMVETCERDRQARMKQGLADRNTAYTHSTCSIARYNVNLFTRNLKESVREYLAGPEYGDGSDVDEAAYEAKYGPRTETTSWIVARWMDRLADIWPEGVGLVLGDVILCHQNFSSGDATSFAMVLRSQILQSLYANYQIECTLNAPGFELTTLKAATLLMTACATALAETAGLDADHIASLVVESGDTSNEAGLLKQADHFAQLIESVAPSEETLKAQSKFVIQMAVPLSVDGIPM